MYLFRLIFELLKKLKSTYTSKLPQWSARLSINDAKSYESSAFFS